ncbi:competence/damage-inducible protein A [Kroppenstedtia eburnea]|uniref:Putative competence-damage inducible protein n=1 Tax=Kroppenstedtia eburnea TaxID=714067 RepID=A0A1N7IU80_9BACL|nr:competence/damage-inducible protein A [Kroppenstedtia eburnea]EGK13721.1 competence/damage-inducible protein CinA [Desmospora sp. 8437]QKI82205.1 competence/damage-inducible protein A [Kroppenstedtia eburnea]SIS40643.1 nicotinamide-nucleotide amidase [Kroppenstedtia eburnea]
MRAELVAVGTELLLGQIVDTHSAFLSRELSQLGIDVYFHTSVGDNRDRLVAVVKRAVSRSDLVIFTGGLGPTEDDLTKETVAEVLGVPLVEHPPSVAVLERLFSDKGQTIPPSNYKQALVFEGGKVFPNPNGTAPGVAVSRNSVTCVLLPGPPTELYPMYHAEVRPFLKSIRDTEEVVVSNVLRFFGIGESHLTERIGKLIQDQTNPTIAPLAKEGEVTLRLTAKAGDLQQAQELMAPVKEEILQSVGRFVYGEDDDTLEKLVISALREQGKRLAVAESCTGGLLAQTLTSVPGSSAGFQGGVVCYANEVKTGMLGVPTELLETCGAVSMDSALALAEGVRSRLNTDFGLSVTGVAGPDPVEEKPVGLVYLGLSERGEVTRAYRLDLGGSREKIQIRAVKQALYTLLERLKKGVAAK